MIESGEKILSPELIGNPTHAEWIRKNEGVNKQIVSC
jgi:hypothetical protein